ncbi:MAG: hypothetical protein K6B17_06740 [Treponema sp.]|nr:hypothetical protein [Treponema sp.]
MAENKKNKRKFDEVVNKLAETETETVDNSFNDEIDGKKKRKSKKDLKQYTFKKLPRFMKKGFTEKQFNKKVLKKIYIAQDKKILQELFVKGGNPEKPELLAIDRKRTFNKDQVLKLKKLSKEIKVQKGRFKLIPFVAVVCSISFASAAGVAFKNQIAKFVIIKACENVFEAKTDLKSVNVEIFGTSMTLKGLAIGNKDHEYRNLFEAEKIEVAFSLAKACRGIFDAENLEASGMRFNTKRTTSCKLPAKQKKEEDSELEKAIREKGMVAINDLERQVTQILGGSSVDEIVASIQADLKTPDASKKAIAETEELSAKWKDKPAEVKAKVADFKVTVEKNKKYSSENAILHAAEIKQTIDEINEYKKYVQKSADEIKTDAGTVNAIKKEVTDAVAHDKAYAKERFDSVSGAVKNSKQIFIHALDAVGYDTLGKYYPYVKQAVAYADEYRKENARKNQKKAEASGIKKEGRSRLKGTTIWYKNDGPSFLIEKVYASGPKFEAKITDISNNQDARGKPIVADVKFNVKSIDHNAILTVDARTYSKEKLITAEYKGKGFNYDFNGTKLAEKKGIPVIDSKAALEFIAKADVKYFEMGGAFDLNPVKLTSDGFENKTVSKYYNHALGSVNRLKADFNASFGGEEGINLSLKGNFADQFSNALKSVISEVGNDAKQAALKKINDQLNNSSNQVLVKAKEFTGIKEELDVQNLKLDDFKKVLEDKAKERLKSEVEEKKKDAEDKVKNEAEKKAKDALKKLF